jgi:hypothetical protein
MIKCKSLISGAFVCAGLAFGAAGCSHPPEAGSTDPHGTYTREQAQAAAQEALKSRNLRKPSGTQNPKSAAPGAGGTAPTAN